MSIDAIQHRALLVASLFYELESRGIEFCVLGANGAFNLDEGDIDLAVKPSQLQNVFYVMRLLESREGTRLRLVSHLQHEIAAHHFIFTFSTNDGPENGIFSVDFCTDYYRNNRRYLLADDLLSERVRVSHPLMGGQLLYSAAPHMNFIYYLIKKIDKGDLSERHAEFLSATYSNATKNLHNLISQFWSPANVQLIKEAAATGSWDSVRSRIQQLRKELRSSRRPTLFDRLAEFLRKARRVRFPTGIHIVLLGVDGSGKSSTIKALAPLLGATVRGSIVYHLFPGHSPREGVQFAPHTKKARGKVGSAAKIMIWLWRFSFGYIRFVYPYLLSSHAVIFDRYFDDLFVDKLRYRFEGWDKLLHLSRQFVARPDIWLVLDAPAEVASARKQEVGPDELNRQCVAYREMAAKLAGAFIIDAARPIDQVTNEAKEIVFQFMNERVWHRIGRLNLP